MRFTFIRRRRLTGWGGLMSAVVAATIAAVPASAEQVTAPKIAPRATWGAKPAETTLMTRHTPHEIVIHHTAESQRPEQTLAQKLQRLQRFSRAEGNVEGRPKPAWGDVPYHYYIDVAGRIGEGRDIDYAGDTNTAYSTADRIQIVVEGNFEREQPSPAQLRSLNKLVIWLAAKYRVPAAKISGHNDHVATSQCPGQHLKTYLPAVRDKVANAASAR